MKKVATFVIAFLLIIASGCTLKNPIDTISSGDIDPSESIKNEIVGEWSYRYLPDGASLEPVIAFNTDGTGKCVSDNKDHFDFTYILTEDRTGTYIEFLSDDNTFPFTPERFGGEERICNYLRISVDENFLSMIAVFEKDDDFCGGWEFERIF